MDKLSDNKDGGVEINAGRDVNIGGDVTGRDKIVNQYIVESPKNTVDELIREIQSKLYGDDSQLPYVLTLCLDLCTRVQLPDHFSLWLRKELAGYDNPSSLRAEFANDGQFESWIKKWAGHRFVKTHLKFRYRSTEDGLSRIVELPFQQFIVSFPLPLLIQAVHSARETSTTEFSFELQDVSEDLMAEVRKFLKQSPIAVGIPSDLKAFYRVSDVELIVAGIRAKIPDVVSEARRRV